MYQQIMIIGNLGRDPEMRYTASGVPVTSFSVAVSRRWTGQDGQRQERTTWFRVSAWRQLAETCGQYLTKGQKVLVIGEMEEPNIWTDQQGNARSSLEITARDVRFLSSRDEAAMGGGMPSSMGMGADDSGPAGNDEDIPF
jgi:single-strand DNA-binding protein